MKRYRLLCAVAGLVIAAGEMRAQSAASPFQLSLVTPVQIVPADRAVRGLRLNLIYGRNTTVDGLDWGLANHTTGAGSSGLQLGLVNMNDAGYEGLSHGFINIVKGRFSGWQDGGINLSEEFKGFQSGFVNRARSMNGLQLGIVNIADQMRGVQIGLVNVIKTGGVAPVLPIVNWSF